jgi:trehalose 6-phosphate phosphatase
LSTVFEAIDSALQVEEWLIALDRDGTLVPYANRPEEAIVTDKTRRLIGDLCARRGIRVAIISARSSAQLRGDFDGVEAILAGNYGMEVVLADGTECIQPYALSAVPDLKEVRDELSEKLDLENGLILEDHGYSLCLHWHNVPISRREELHSAIVESADRFPQLKFRRLPTSYEVLPNIPWDKGFGLSFIDASIGGDFEGRVRFFGGDTEADSPAFEYVNDRGGISVRVGKDGELLRAQFNVDTPEALHEVLEYIARRREPRIERASA